MILEVGVESEHGGEDKDIGVEGGVEKEVGVVGWRTEPRAVVDEQCHPVVVVVEGVVDDLCMELPKMTEVAYSGGYAAQL